MTCYINGNKDIVLFICTEGQEVICREDIELAQKIIKEARQRDKEVVSNEGKEEAIDKAYDFKMGTNIGGCEVHIFDMVVFP